MTFPRLAPNGKVASGAGEGRGERSKKIDESLLNEQDNTQMVRFFSADADSSWTKAKAYRIIL